MYFRNLRKSLLDIFELITFFHISIRVKRDLDPASLFHYGLNLSFESVGIRAGNGNDDFTFRGTINQALDIDMLKEIQAGNF